MLTVLFSNLTKNNGKNVVVGKKFPLLDAGLITLLRSFNI